VLYTLQYYLANLLLTPAFPHHRTHRPYGAGRELVGWLSRLARLPGRTREAGRIEQGVLAGPAPFFFFPLQLDSDTQIRVHSPYVSMPNAIRRVVASFARHAGADALLLVKNHPLDNGLIDYGALLRELAYRYGLGARVRFIDGGDTARLVRAARGVVVVNSTVGMSALHHGRPTIALGTAIYDMPGLTCQLGLDAFWTRPEPPDARLFQAFRRVVIQETQINGNFYGGRGLALAVAGAAARLEAARAPVFQPQHAPASDDAAEGLTPLPRAQPRRAARNAEPGRIATT
jgi:capsular polysaccharide export protein